MDSAPDGWKVIRFDDFTTLQRGKDLTKSQFKAGSVPVAGSNGIIGYHDESFVKASGVTVGRSGSCGKVSFYAVDFWAHNTSLYVRDFHSNDERFAAYFLEFLDLSRFQTGASVPTLDRNSFKELPLTVPGVGEQRRVARVLSTVQNAIEQQTRLIALTKELKRALMKKLFTEGLRGEKQKITEIGPLPESWRIAPLGDCATIQTGIAKGRAIENDESLELPYLRVANVQDGFLDLAEMKTIVVRAKERERYLLRKGDVVLTEGGDFDKLGRGFIWQGEVENCVHQNHIFAVRVNRSMILPEFFAYQTQSPYGKDYFFSVAHKTSNLACINASKLKRFPVLIPSIDEQSQIGHLFQAVDAKLSNHTGKHASLKELFRTLLDQLMTAQVRVNGPEFDFLNELKG